MVEGDTDTRDIETPDNETPDTQTRGNRRSRTREKTQEYARQNARSALIEANGIAVKRCNACVVI